MTEINKQNLEALGFTPDELNENLEIKEAMPYYEMYNSECGRFSVFRTDESNIKEYGWHIHVDNSDFETIANGDIEYIEQVEVFMNLYKNY